MRVEYGVRRADCGGGLTLGFRLGGGGPFLKRPSDRKGRSDGVETDIFMLWLGETAGGDMLVKYAEVD